MTTDKNDLKLERLAMELYEQGRARVAGRPAWGHLDPDDAYDMGMRETAFTLARREMRRRFEDGIPKIGNALLQWLDGVVGIVEANSYERQALWDRYATQAAKRDSTGDGPRYDWKSESMGYAVQVGALDGRPIMISLTIAFVRDHKLLFWYAQSQVVDHVQCDAWIAKNMPRSAYRRRDPERLNTTDAMNFHNVFGNLEKEEQP